MALKIKTVKPPVVIAELKILPMSLPNVPPILLAKAPANCGTKRTPRPIPNETARINIFRRFMSTVERILIPAIATVPNITIVAPPRTDAGSALNIEPTCGNKPISIKIPPIHTPT